MLSKYLLKFLKANKITQVEFSRALGVTPSAASYWIAGKRVPKISFLDQIVNFISGQTGREYQPVLVEVMECIIFDVKGTLINPIKVNR